MRKIRLLFPGTILLSNDIHNVSPDFAESFTLPQCRNELLGRDWSPRKKWAASCSGTARGRGPVHDRLTALQDKNCTWFLMPSLPNGFLIKTIGLWRCVAPCITSKHGHNNKLPAQPFRNLNFFPTLIKNCSFKFLIEIPRKTYIFYLYFFSVWEQSTHLFHCLWARSWECFVMRYFTNNLWFN